MKKYTISIILFFVFFNSFSQQSLFAEYDYLRILNTQNNKELTKGNFYNAELVAEKLVVLKSENSFASHYFLELAKNYFLVENFEMAAFTILRQQYLFPNEEINISAEKVLQESCYRLNKSKEEISKIFDPTSVRISTLEFDKRLKFLLKSTILLNQKELNTIGLKYLGYYKISSKNLTYWQKQWEFFTLINVKNSKRLDLIKFDTKTNKKLYETLSDADKKYVLLKAEKHYRKDKARNQAKYYNQEYKSLNLSFTEKYAFRFRQIFMIN